MERAHRTPVATFYVPGSWPESVDLNEGASHHASVKRLAVGEPVRLSNGAGRRCYGEIAEIGKRNTVVAVDASSVEDVAQPTRVELLAPVADRDRMLMLAEKAVELGLSSWRPVIYARSRSVSPRGEGDAFREKVRARQIGALEQSGGAWLPELHPEVTLEAVLNGAAMAPAVLAARKVFLDVDGEPFVDFVRRSDGPVQIVLGPEGGLDDDERSRLVGAGWMPASLGTNVLRFETAGIAALALVRSPQR